ncbi:MAG: nucleoside phosphorylase [Planctomycetes bacterium]|nr:nucleoside phosphorylase [Planctomycetota bacterium]
MVQDTEGRQYHIGLGPGEVARNILLVGDPDRARRCASWLDSVEGSWSHREYVTSTGTWNGTRVTVMATGIGCDNTEIALVELAALVPVGPVHVIRAGTCGALQPGIQLGDLIVTWGAVRLESTSLYFVPEGYPACSDPEVIAELRAAAARVGCPHHFGMTATAPGFYGAQGRTTPQFRPRYPDLIEELARVGVVNLEMETSTLLTLSALAGFRAGAVCTAFARRGAENDFVRPEQKIEFENRALHCALDALRHLDARTSEG